MSEAIISTTAIKIGSGFFGSLLSSLPPQSVSMSVPANAYMRLKISASIASSVAGAAIQSSITINSVAVLSMSANNSSRSVGFFEITAPAGSTVGLQISAGGGGRSASFKYAYQMFLNSP
jgi:hypothetical protein